MAPRKSKPRKKKVQLATKKDLMKLRSTIVETKARTQETGTEDTDSSATFSLDSDHAGTVLVNNMNVGWKRGLGDTRFQGDEVTMKYLTQKLRFAFPIDNYQISKPYRLQVIWGFITRPAGFTEFGEDENNAGTLSRSHYAEEMTKLVSQPWNDKDDFMNFRKKEKTIYKIIGKRWVKPNRNAGIGMPGNIAQGGTPGTITIAGSVPDVNMQLHWPVKGRKWRLRYSDDSEDPGAGSPTPGVQNPFFYNNESWVPFTVIYAPDYDNVVGGEYAQDAAKVKVTHNCKCWFTDS